MRGVKQPPRQSVALLARGLENTHEQEMNSWKVHG